MFVLVWVQTICIGYQLMTKVADSKERVENKEVRDQTCVVSPLESFHDYS